MPAVTVDDPADPRLADYRALRDPERRMRVEAAGGFFIVEGALAIATLLRSGRRARSLLLVQREHERLASLLAGCDAPVYLAERALLRELTGFDVHRGALAAADRFPLPEPADLLTGARRVVVLEAIGDHANLGALFRSAAGFGLDAVLLCPRCADPLYRRSVRVSLGHVLSVPFGRLEALPGGLAPLTAAGFETLALTPDPSAEPLDAVAADPPARAALLLGSEGPGLAPATLAAAGRRVRIPLAGQVDSLNVATAGAIAMHRLSLLPAH